MTTANPLKSDGSAGNTTGGSITDLRVNELNVQFDQIRSESTRTAFLDAAKMAEKEADEWANKDCDSRIVSAECAAASAAYKRFAVRLHRAAEGVKSKPATYEEQAAAYERVGDQYAPQDEGRGGEG